MRFQHTAPIVGPCRLRLIQRLTVASIITMLALPVMASPASAAVPKRETGAALTIMLAKASEGLLMPSESDYPFTPFVWTKGAKAKCVTTGLLKLTGHAPETPVEIVDLDYFFRNVAQSQPWHDPIQAQNVPKFKHLMTVLKDNLTDIHVYRVGTVQIDVYILGKSGKNLAGLSTVLIET